jgi:predicted site-specific integrase-resolvase
MKLSTWAKKQGVHYNTAYKWFKDGKFPCKAYQTESSTIIVEDEIASAKQSQDNIVVYCRVSNQSRKEELNYQVDRCLTYCNAKGLSVNKVYKEVASGMNDNRKEFWKMLDSNPTRIVIENKDRLTRFGFNYLDKLLLRNGCVIDVMNPNSNDEQDLIKDLVSVITSFCCRLYGLRRTKKKVQQIKDLVHMNQEVN